jgi:hypothetical protein
MAIPGFEFWTCHVCGEERPDDRISVYTEEVGIASVNVRFCNDRPACQEGAPEADLLVRLKRLLAEREQADAEHPLAPLRDDVPSL